MGNWGFWDWLTYGGITISALVIAIDTAISQSDGIARRIPRLLKIKFVGYLPLACIIIATCAALYKESRPVDFVLPPDAVTSASPFAVVQAWGLDGGAFYIVAKTDSLAKNGKLSRLMLVVRVPFADRDKMTDENIIKSQLYTISGGFMTLAIPMTSMIGLKVLADRPTPIEFSLVEIPFLYSADQVRSLSDVEKLGGKFLASVGTQAEFVKSVPPTDPQVACPPTLIPQTQRKRT
jgi:hypothetical protein